MQESQPDFQKTNRFFFRNMHIKAYSYMQDKNTALTRKEIPGNANMCVGAHSADVYNNPPKQSPPQESP
ncbi:MAG: hypothetical protein H6Q00_1325 [Holophagaceae bacterium]|nr:hypothetical protein [Holophagaceae bacterium]